MKQTALANLTQALIMPYLNKDFYPTKHDKRPKPPVIYHYEVKYVPKGVPYVNPDKKASRRDRIRFFGKANLKGMQ